MSQVSTDVVAIKKPLVEKALAKLWGSKVIQVFAGPEHDLTYIHVELLADKAPGLVGLVEQGIDGGFNFVNLSDVNAKTFDLYSFWLYTDTLPARPCNRPEILTANTSERINLAVLAENLGAPALVNLVRAGFVGYFDLKGDVPSMQDVITVYENTAPGSSLRAWIVELLYVRICLNTPPLTIHDLKIIGGRAEIATDVLISITGKTTPNMFSIQSMRDALDNLAEGNGAGGMSQIFLDCLVKAVQPHSRLH